MKKKGFTLIELLAVIVVLGIIALISVPQIVKVVNSSKEEAFLASLENLVKSFEVLNSDGSMSGQSYDAVEVTDPVLPKSNEEFISGEVGYNANDQIEVRYVTNGIFCAVGTSGNFTIEKGNCSTLDSTGPIISNVAIIPGKYTARIVTTASDDETAIVKYEYSLEGANFITMSNDFEITNLQAGTEYEIILRVTNSAGAYTDWKTSFITLNLDEAIVSITPLGWSTTKTVTITYPADYTGYYNKNGEGWVLATDNTSVLEFTEKGFVIVMVSDGNTIKQSITYNIEKIDNDYPNCVIVVKDPEVWKSSKTLTIKGQDASSGVAGIQAPGENYFSVGGEIKREATYIGTYTAVVKDISGKTSTCTAAVTKVDGTAPLNVMANIVSTSTSTIVVEGLGIDSETGIAKYEFRLDNEEYRDGGTENIFTFNAVSTGEHTVQVRVTNGVGLTAESTAISATANTATVPTYSVSPDGWAQAKTVVITYPTRQSSYTYEYTTDGATWNVVNSGVTKSVVFTANGYIIARINDGTNYFTAASFNVSQVDSTAPIISSVTTSNTTKAITVNVTASDAESGITNYEYKLTGNGNTVVLNSNTNSTVFSDLQTNTYEVSVTVKNGTNMTTTSSNYSVTLPAIPEATCSSISSVWEASKSITITYPSSASDLGKAYNINNGGWATTTSLTKTQTYTAPGVIAARITDGINTKTKECQITHVDATDPVIDVGLSGTIIYKDPTFVSGNNSIVLYNNSNNGNVTITRKSMSTPSGSYALELKTTGTASPNFGGFTFETPTSAGKVLITRIIAKIPTNYVINFNTNSTGNGSTEYWLTSQLGTGNWQEYVHVLISGSSGTFSTTNFYSISGTIAPTSSSPLTWYLGYATVISSEDYDATNSIVFRSSDPESKIVGYGYNQSNTTAPTFTTVTATDTLVKTINGITTNGTYYVWTKDGAGRTNKKAVVVNRIDTTPPSCTWSAPNNSAINEGASTTINLTCTDTGGIMQGNYTASSIRNYITATSGLTIGDITRNGTTNSYVYTISVTAQNSPGLKVLTLAANALADGAGNYNTSVSSSQITVNPSVVTQDDFLITSDTPALYGRIIYQSSREGANQMFRVRTAVYTTSSNGWRCDRFAVRIVINGQEIVSNGTIKDETSSNCGALGKNVLYYYPSSTGWSNWYSYNDTRTSGTTAASFYYWDTGWDTNTSHYLGQQTNHDHLGTRNTTFNIIPYSW